MYCYKVETERLIMNKLKLHEYTALVDAELESLDIVRKRGDHVREIQSCFDQGVRFEMCAIYIDIDVTDWGMINVV